jgi:ABC-type multidrug transport system fused ATPase/permease subunit
VFGWDSNGPPTLGGRAQINITIPCGSLCIIVGRVGSGKSSLLSALLGMIDKRQGRVLMPSGAVAFCPQQAWLANDTVRGNILFGNSFFPGAYEDAIKVCNLKSDLRLLPGGDLTEIGERGVTLSGGQRQRISLARAVYANTDTVLLDDVLSAVDPHVGKSIFDECICGAMGGKTRVMVTNAVQFLPNADLILVLDGSGNVAFQGSYSMLRQSGLQVDQYIPADEAPPHPDGMVAGAATYRAKEDREPYKADEKKQLQTDEERAVGAVSTDVISRYITACGETLWYFAAFVVLAEVAQATSDLWLAAWSDRRLSPSPGSNFYLTVYVILGLVVAGLSFLRGISAVEASIRASRQLHVQMLTSVLRAPAGFFDVTPLGRILARFSKDLDSLDTSLADGLNSFCTVVSMTVGTLCVVLIALPPFAIALVPLGAFYSQIMQYYWSDGRDSAPEQVRAP